MLKLGRFLILLVALCVIRCGSKEGNEETQAHVSEKQVATPPLTLVKQDQENIYNVLDQRSIEQYDNGSSHLFTRIFGGTSPGHVLNYLNERNHYYFTKGDVTAETEATFSGDSFGWTKDPDFKANLERQNAEVLASNLGSTLWLATLINQKPISITLNGEAIPVASSRVGLILLGEAYTDKRYNKKNELVTIAPVVRYAMTIHEGRHSDCTGGIDEADLAAARKAQTHREYLASIKHLSCLHQHVYCPEGHPYANLPACDAEPWGAFGVANVFAEAVYNSESADSYSFTQASIIVSDTARRLMVNRSGVPDMTSTDQVSP